MSDFSVEGIVGTLIVLSLAILATSAVVVLLFKWIKWSPTIRAPIGKRVVRLIVLLLSPYLAGWLWFRLEHVHTRGNWRCAVCAVGEHRDEVFGVIVHRGSERLDNEEELASAHMFHEWYMSRSVRPHHHVWIPVGGHSCAGGVGDAFYPSHSWYAALPRVSDPKIPERLLARVECSDELGALKLVRDFDGEIWTRIASGESPSTEELHNGVDAWLAEHPEWR